MRTIKCHGSDLRGAYAARRRVASVWFGGALMLLVACAHASPCDRANRTLTSAQRADFAVAVADQLETSSAKILRSYRIGNWYLLYVDTRVADEAFVFFRGDPPTHRYVALWNGAGARTGQDELRIWARTNAPGVPETLAKCFAAAAIGRHDR
jgi:hypothetical protein